MFYCNVSHDEFIKILSCSENSQALQYIRWTYQHSTSQLQMKVTVSPEHEVAVETFCLYFNNQIIAMGLDEELDVLGPTVIMAISPKGKTEAGHQHLKIRGSAVLEVALSG